MSFLDMLHNVSPPTPGMNQQQPHPSQLHQHMQGLGLPHPALQMSHHHHHMVQMQPQHVDMSGAGGPGGTQLIFTQHTPQTMMMRNGQVITSNILPPAMMGPTLQHLGSPVGSLPLRKIESGISDEEGEGDGDGEGDSETESGVVNIGNAEGQPKKRRVESAARKSKKCVMERKRRKDLNEGFTLLRQALPLTISRPSKTSLLQCAVEYIKQLENEVVHLRDENRNLRKATGQ